MCFPSPLEAPDIAKEASSAAGKVEFPPDGGPGSSRSLLGAVCAICGGCEGCNVVAAWPVWASGIQGRNLVETRAQSKKTKQSEKSEPAQTWDGTSMDHEHGRGR